MILTDPGPMDRPSDEAIWVLPWVRPDGIIPYYDLVEPYMLPLDEFEMIPDFHDRLAQISLITIVMDHQAHGKRHGEAIAFGPEVILEVLSSSNHEERRLAASMSIFLQQVRSMMYDEMRPVHLTREYVDRATLPGQYHVLARPTEILVHVDEDRRLKMADGTPIATLRMYATGDRDDPAIHLTAMSAFTRWPCDIKVFPLSTHRGMFENHPRLCVEKGYETFMKDAGHGDLKDFVIESGYSLVEGIAPYIQAFESMVVESDVTLDLTLPGKNGISVAERIGRPRIHHEEVKRLVNDKKTRRHFMDATWRPVWVFGR